MMYLQTVWQRKSVTAGTEAHVTSSTGREKKRRIRRGVRHLSRVIGSQVDSCKSISSHLVLGCDSTCGSSVHL